ncbi:MAG: hypothetical protein LBP59_06950 [Planctomycetaceae bacterium]|nr:hypothetical protein [Planctomycetaceae bacterium]
MVLLFFIFGPLLTLLILGGVILRKLPSNVVVYERAAMLATGLRWEIGAVEYRKLNQIRFKNVRLFRSNSSKPFFAASEIDLVYVSGGVGRAGDVTKNNRNRLFPGVVNLQNAAKNPNNILGVNTGGISGTVKRFFGVGNGDGFWRLLVGRSLVDLTEGGDGVGVGKSNGNNDGNNDGNNSNNDGNNNSNGNSNGNGVGISESNIGDKFDGGVVLRECFLELIARMELLSVEPVFITFDEIDVIGTSLNRFKLRFVAGNLYQTESAIRSEWNFLIPLVSETESERISIVRRRNSRSLAVTLKTGNMPLPCEFIAIFCPSFRILGGYPARVSGEIMASVEYLGGGGIGGGGAAAWEYSLRNVFFNDINIERFMAGSLPYILRGNVRGFRVNEAYWGGGKLRADGWVEIVEGVIERGLFHRIVKNFALTVMPESILDSPRMEYPFTQCVFNYKIDHNGVIFWKERLSDEAGNVFMFKTGDGVQTQPMAVSLPDGNGKLVSYHNVLSIFAPDSAPIVPLTPLSKFLIPLLPTNTE